MTDKSVSRTSPSDKVSDSGTLTPDTRPAKPSPDFPLFAHRTGRWAKKVKGKLIYLGPWSDPDGALKTWRAIESGKTIKQAKAVAKRQPAKDKPAKPSPDFPLFAHASRRWAKKVRGKLIYFGKWEQTQDALAKWLKEKDYLLAGKRPPESADGLTVSRLADHFFESKRKRHEASELTSRSLADYEQTCLNIIAAFGRDMLVTELTESDFGRFRAKLAKGRGPATLGNEINRCRMLFNFAWKNGHIDRPIRFGSEFNRPSKKTLRIARAAKGEMLLTPEQIIQLTHVADVQLRAMILLGVNCGLGNADCAGLTTKHIDLDASTIDYPRQKTGVARRAILWPATVTALKAAITDRYTPKDKADTDIVFVTKYKNRWEGKDRDCPISKAFKKLLNGMKIGRKGMSFYCLRHCFRTAADTAGDQRAIDRIMGHESSHISSAYIERIDDTRLQAVADHVHRWLFNEPMAMNTTGKRGVK